jgi:rhomboid family GlyGly-CTERM serine protease
MGLRALRFPWATAGLAGLCALAAMVPPEILQYDRAAGEVWRLVTGQLVHWTPRMALLDLGMLLGLGARLETRGDRRRMVVALAVGGALTALAVAVFSPGLLLYRGSSGLASALFVLAALRIAEESGGSRPLALTAVALFLAKAAVEALTGQTLFAGPLPKGVEVVPLVHLAGGIAGLGGLLPRLETGQVNAVIFRANPW